MNLRKFLLACAVLLTAMVASSQTPIYYGLTGTISNPDGTPFNGTLSIELARPTAANVCTNPVSIVSQKLVKYQIVNGVIVNGTSAQFLSNTCLNPSVPYFVQIFDKNNVRTYVDNWFFTRNGVTNVDVGTFKDVGMFPGQSGGGGGGSGPTSSGIAVWDNTLGSWATSLGEVDGKIIYGSSGAWTVGNALPNGTTASTQSCGTNLNDVATGQYVANCAASSGTPGGSSFQLQYNNAGSFAGAAFAGLVYSNNTSSAPSAATSTQVLSAIGVGNVTNTYLANSGFTFNGASVSLGGSANSNWTSGTFIANNLTSFFNTSGQLQDSGIASGNVTQTTSTPAANQIGVYGSTSKTLTPTTTLPTAAVPAFTGDVTNSAGSLSTTVGAIKNTAVPTLATGYLYFNGTSFIWQTPSGSGTINAATQYDTPYYSAAGSASTISGAAISGLVKASTSGVPAAATSSDVLGVIGAGNVTNTYLANTATTVNGAACTLGSTCNANYTTGTLTANDLAQMATTGGQLNDSGIATANVTQTTATPAANQIAVYGSTAKTLTPTTTLPTAAMPALTGDVTNSAGSLSTTVGKVNGLAIPTTKTIVGTNSSGQFIDATSTTLPTAMVPAFTGDVTNTSGSLSTTVGKLENISLPTLALSTGYLYDNNGVLGLQTPSGSGTVNAASQNDITYYSGAGSSTVVSGAAISGLVKASTGGAPVAATSSDVLTTIGSSNITNTYLANTGTTVNGQTCTLGSSCNGNYTTGTITGGDVASFSGTTGLLQDAGVASANLVTAASNFTSGDLVQAAGANKTTSDSSIATANVTQTTATPAANQIGVYGSTAKTLTPTTTLPTAAMPALTGDVTNSAGSLSTTVGQIEGAAIPTSAAVVGTNGSKQLVSATSANVLSTIGSANITNTYLANTATTVNGQTCTLGSTCTVPLSAINPQTATYQVLAADFSNYKTIAVASGTFTITLVASGSQPANGQYITIVNYGSGVVTVARSGQNINGATTSLSLPAGSSTNPTNTTVWSDGTNYFAAVKIDNANTVSTTGSPANGNLTKFSGTNTVTNADLSGDCTTSGGTALTCTKTNGTAFGTLATIGVGTLTNNDFCTYVTGTGIVCNSSGGSMTWPAAAGFAIYSGSSSWGTSFTVGTMTNGDLCTFATSGNTIACNTSPGGTGTVTDGAGTTTAGIIPESTTTAHTLDYSSGLSITSSTLGYSGSGGISSTATGAGKLALTAGDTTHTYGFSAPATSGSANVSWALPNADSHGVVTSDGSANLSLTPAAQSDPTQIVYVDDFLTGLLTTGNVGNLSWTMSGSTTCGTATTPASSSPNFGQFQTTTGTTSGNTCGITFNTAGALGALGNVSNGWKMIWIFKIPTTTTMGAYVGASDSLTAVPSNWFGMRYDTSSSDTTFHLCVSSTCDSTTYTLDSNFHKLTITNNSAGNITMQFDSNTARTFCASGCNTTVTPTTNALTPIAQAVTRTSAARNIDVDYFGFQEIGLSR